MSGHLLFVYGSLRSGFHHPAYSYISEHFDLLGKGQVKGELFDLGDFPAAIPSAHEKFVVGELYQLKDGHDWDWVIAQIDDYEGVQTDDGSTPMYYRAEVQVHVGNETYDAWIYWFNGTISDQPRIESGDILEFKPRNLR
jgi:gamma-glutamylcyclotransferase (GGCT)/AIG2-like uncharacterized protein YtfP